MYDELSIPKVPPLPEGDPEFLRLPRILFGKQRETRKAWRTIARQAWKQGAWGDLLDSLELVPAASLGDAIFFSPPIKLFGSDPVVWRLYHVRDVLCDMAYKSGDGELGDAAATRRYDDLVLEGMERFWFAVGMLGQDGGGGVLTTSRDLVPELPQRAHRYLQKLVYWIPEMWSVGENLCYDMSGIRGDDPFKETAWLSEILGLTYLCSDGISFQVIQDKYGNDILTALQSEGIIEPDGEGRYRPCPPGIPYWDRHDS
jgi:hypothetical protein